MPFAAIWMGLEFIVLSEVSQTETNMTLLICGILKKIQINLFTKQNQTHRYRKKLMVTKGERWGSDKLGGWD